MRNGAQANKLLGRVLAVGDVHGCARALDRLLEVVQPALADTFVFLGDYVAKGPDSAGVLDRLIALAADYRVVPLLGNHDEMMLAAIDDPSNLDGWLRASRDSTLQSYGDDPARVPAAHTAFLRNCRDTYETARHIFVHANVDPDRPLDRQSAVTLRWERFTGDERPHRSGKTLICGHASQKSGTPLDVGHAVCIDTYCWGGGWLTCLDVNKGHLWQAAESGAVRTAWLDELPRSGRTRPSVA